PHQATASRHPYPVRRKSLGFRNSLSRSLDANSLLDLDGPELQGLRHDGLLMMADAAHERQGGGHDGGGDDNALQTLHGLLSFGDGSSQLCMCRRDVVRSISD